MLEALAGIGIGIIVVLIAIFFILTLIGLDHEELLPVGLWGAILSLIALATICLNRALVEVKMQQEAVKHGVGGYVSDKEGKPQFEWKTLAENPSATSAPVK
jgi:hypothetical protein